MEDLIIYFAADHAGFVLKNELLAYVRDELGYTVIDCGAYSYNAEDDFTDFIAKAAREVSAYPLQRKAIILGGSGQGEAMLANRFHDVRATVYYGGNEEIITLSREHNDANVLSLGARFLEVSEAKQIVALWLKTPHVSVPKYDRRIEEIDLYAPMGRPKMSVVPSLPAQSFAAIETLLQQLQGDAKEIQIDIVDGHFVPHTSWPFTETDHEGALRKLASYTPAYDIEVDCMCTDPEQYLDVLAEIGVKRVIIHAGSTTHYEACIAHARAHGYRIGLAFTNDIPLQELKTIIPHFDFVQVMGIKEVGTQGQPFDERTLSTIRLLRKVHPMLEIAVDGAVNESTIPQLFEAGANRFAPGSAVAQAPQPRASYKHLKALIGL